MHLVSLWMSLMQVGDLLEVGFDAIMADDEVE
jgi:hypothetical protein